MDNKKECFVISPIGEEGSLTRKRSDQILKHIITPAVTECGFEPLRADQISEPGLITGQIIDHIFDAPLVIADLTGRNPNVFYELAIRHVIRKPFIQLIQKDEELPFDIKDFRTIFVDHQDLDSVEDARINMISHIKAATKRSAIVVTPISRAFDVQNMKTSSKPEQRSLAELIEGVSEIQTGIVNIKKDLASSSASNKFNFRDISLILDRIRDMSMSIRKQIHKIQKWALPKAREEDDTFTLYDQQFAKVKTLSTSIHKNIDELESMLNLD
jgi:hypothetical protein